MKDNDFANIVIVGRPNVGKSTLFNRLFGKRKAIVQEEQGTTRDLNIEKIQYRDKKFNLYDSGGVNFDHKDIIQKEIEGQVQLAIEKADLILFLIDFQDGITSLDEKLADHLRQMSKHTILVVNKVDDYKKLFEMNEFYQLGLKRIEFISALHNHGVGDLLDSIYELLPDKHYEFNEDYQADFSIAIVGEANAGKSTYFNKLIGENRSIVTDVPGTTRDAIDAIIECKGNRLRLIDTAGYMIRKRIKDPSTLFSMSRTREAIKAADIVLLFFDAKKGFLKTSKVIAKMIEEQGKPAVLIGNKWDLVEFKKKEYEQELKIQIGFLEHFLFETISGENRINIGKPLEKACLLWDKANQRIPTKQLNTFLAKIVDKRLPPPKTKLNYIVQTGVAPPVFTLFAKNSKTITSNYLVYVKNQIRSKFDLGSIPIRLFLRETPKD